MNLLILRSLMVPRWWNQSCVARHAPSWHHIPEWASMVSYMKGQVNGSLCELTWPKDTKPTSRPRAHSIEMSNSGRRNRCWWWFWAFVAVNLFQARLVWSPDAARAEMSSTKRIVHMPQRVDEFDKILLVSVLQKTFEDEVTNFLGRLDLCMICWLRWYGTLSVISSTRPSRDTKQKKIRVLNNLTKIILFIHHRLKHIQRRCALPLWRYMIPLALRCE